MSNHAHFIHRLSYLVNPWGIPVDYFPSGVPALPLSFARPDATWPRTIFRGRRVFWVDGSDQRGIGSADDISRQKDPQLTWTENFCLFARAIITEADSPKYFSTPRQRNSVCAGKLIREGSIQVPIM